MPRYLRSSPNTPERLHTRVKGPRPWIFSDVVTGGVSRGLSQPHHRPARVPAAADVLTVLHPQKNAAHAADRRYVDALQGCDLTEEFVLSRAGRPAAARGELLPAGAPRW